MRRALYALLALLTLLVIAGGFLWYFAYGMSEAPPDRAAVSGLSRSVAIDWNDAGIATIRADSTLDRYAALGYVHGAQRPWLVTLWRQTATGRLGEWYGDNLLSIDRLVRRLGFAELARQTFSELPDDERSLLQAYAAGMNSALRGQAVQNRAEFALLDEDLERWEPWHTLAVERLYAYLASSPPSPDSLRRQNAPPEALRYLRADSSLRRWLRVHDLQRSATWAARDGASTHLFYRHVYGSSAIPLLQAVLLQRPGAANVAALSLPGTPFLVAGRAGRRAWGLLPDGALNIVRAPHDTSTAPRHERILGSEGSEYLVTFRRSSEALLLSPPDTTLAPRSGAAARSSTLGRPEGRVLPADTTRVDSTWQVRWSGFQPVTDLEGWRALAQGQAPDEGESSFRLVRAGGITVDSSGSFSFFGTPARAIRFEDGLVAGHPTWTPYLAEQVEARLRSTPNDSTSHIQPLQWVQADSSTWAARLAPDMLASIDSLSRTQRGTFTYEERTDIFGQAIRYLRNWNFAYDRAAIGASIFDTWVAVYRREIGRLPAVRATVDSLVASDSLRILEDRRRFRLLDEAVSQLRRRYGEDIEEWRWETVAPDTRYFPGWTDSLLTGRRLRRLAATRYAPIEIPGGGHPSTLNWGTSPIRFGAPAPASYESWLGTDEWGTLYVRRRRFDTGAPFGRYRAQHAVPDPIALQFDTTRAVRSTTLVPADSAFTQPQQAGY